MEQRDIKIMGIINLTDNSFWQGSRMLGRDGAADPGAVSERAAEMIAAGASILDLGACSTRPGSEPVGAEEEWRRLEKPVRRLREDFPDVPISVDTYWASVISHVADAIGAPVIINDISAGEADSGMLPLAGKLGFPYIAMHMRGTPATMQTLTDYESDPSEPGLSPVTAAVLRYFRAFSGRAEENGIRDWILDPGFGFAKTMEQNWQLLGEMSALKELGKPILAGLSRKSMITKALGIDTADALTPTQVANFAALERGADILRVHDVAEAAQTVRIYRLMDQSSGSR